MAWVPQPLQRQNRHLPRLAFFCAWHGPLGKTRRLPSVLIAVSGMQRECFSQVRLCFFFLSFTRNEYVSNPPTLPLLLRCTGVHGLRKKKTWPFKERENLGKRFKVFWELNDDVCQRSSLQGSFFQAFPFLIHSNVAFNASDINFLLSTMAGRTVTPYRDKCQPLR